MPEPRETQRQRLYHFTKAKYALDDIRHARLKIARIADLNDPFELRCMDTSRRDMRWAYSGWRNHVATHNGVLCFSERSDDLLQWAHYADRHRGICLGFDVAGGPSKFGRVRYATEKEPPPDKPDEAFVWRCLSTKFEAWEYEREWRVFTTLEESVRSEDDSEIFFASFEEDLILREVLLGAECKTTAKEIFDTIANYDSQVRVVRMLLADSTFELKPRDCIRVVV